MNHPEPGRMSLITKTKSFRAVAETVVPEVRQLDESQWRDFANIVEHALAQRPAAMRRQLSIFLQLINVMSLLTRGRTLPHLIPAMRAEFLQTIESSRLLLIRRGFWGLRTLILMGFYARPAAMPLIGYRAHVRGWENRLSV